MANVPFAVADSRLLLFQSRDHSGALKCSANVDGVCQCGVLSSGITDGSKIPGRHPRTKQGSGSTSTVDGSGAFCLFKLDIIQIGCFLRLETT